MVMFSRITAAALLIASVTLTGCLDKNQETAPEVPVAPEVTMNDLIVANSETVRDAVEAYALENNGVYSTVSIQRNLANKKLQDYLPNGELLVNPYTGWTTEPSIGAHPHEVGDTGYIALVNSEGIPNGYVINGLNEDLEFIGTIRKEPID